MTQYNEWRSLVDLQVYNDIPDSAVYRLKLNDVGGTIEDSIGDLSPTNNGVTSVSGDYQGGSAGEGDGSSAYINLNSPLPDVGWSSDFAVAFTIDNWSASDVRQNVIGLLDGSARARIEGGDTENEDVLTLRLRDDNENTARIESASVLGDCAKYRVVFNRVGNDASNWEVFVNAVDDTGPSTGSLNTGLTFSNDFHLFARNNSGAQNFLPGILDDAILYGDSLTDSGVQADYDNQPWT